MGSRNFAQVLSSNLQGSDSGLAQAGERPWHSYETLYIMVLERDKAPINWCRIASIMDAQALSGYAIQYVIYPPVIKHGNGKSPN
jgi:hypothetical protein